MAELEAFRISSNHQAADELTIIAKVESGKLMWNFRGAVPICCLSHAHVAEVAFDKILEVPCKRKFCRCESAKGCAWG